MSITSQLPPIALAQASASLRALAQAAGQTVEARVLGQSSNGMTQVQIGRQMVNLALPQSQPVGTTLTLSVQQSDGQLRLALVAVRPPGVEAAPVPPAVTGASPATSVQLSAAALSSQPPSAPQSIASQSAGTGAATITPTVAASASRLPPAYGGPAPQAPTAVAVGSVAAAGGVPTGAGSVSQAATGSPAAVAPTATATEQLPVGSAAPAGRTAAAPVLPASPPLVAGSASAGPAAAPAGAAPVAPMSGGPVGLGPVAPASVPAVAGAVPTPGAIRADIPYAVAAPVQTPNQTSVGSGSTATGLPPVGQTTSSTATGQHAPTNVGTPGGAAPPAGTVAPATAAPAPPAVTPQAALAQMVQQALPRQDSILGLTTALTAIAGKVALPEPVAKAAQQVLAGRLSFDGGKLGGVALKAAIQQSGVFQEALLASGQGQAAASDLKSSLLALRQGLGAWLGNQAPVAQVGTVAPPLRGQVPRARAGEGQPMDLPDDPMEIGKHLLERSEAALSRLRLQQNASLPDPNPMRQEAQWNMDLPVVVGGQQHVLHMQIQGDGEQDAERPQDRGWQVRFAINLAERGEAGAQISLRGKNTGVLIWADHPETAQSLALAVEDLRVDLAGIGLVPGAIVVRSGPPAEQPVQPVGQAGHYVDAKR